MIYKTEDRDWIINFIKMELVKVRGNSIYPDDKNLDTKAIVLFNGFLNDLENTKVDVYRQAKHRTDLQIEEKTTNQATKE